MEREGGGRCGLLLFPEVEPDVAKDWVEKFCIEFEYGPCTPPTDGGRGGFAYAGPQPAG